MLTEIHIGDQSDVISEAIQKAFNNVGGPEINSLTIEAILAKYNPLALNAIAPSRKTAADLAKEFGAQWNTKLVIRIKKLDIINHIPLIISNSCFYF